MRKSFFSGALTAIGYIIFAVGIIGTIVTFISSLSIYQNDYSSRSLGWIPFAVLIGGSIASIASAALPIAIGHIDGVVCDNNRRISQLESILMASGYQNNVPPVVSVAPAVQNQRTPVSVPMAPINSGAPVVQSQRTPISAPAAGNNSGIICPNCGKIAPQDAKFCRGCGGPLQQYLS